MSALKIAGGRVIDPANGVDEIRDIWIADARVVAAPTDPDPRRSHHRAGETSSCPAAWTCIAISPARK